MEASLLGKFKDSLEEHRNNILKWLGDRSDKNGRVLGFESGKVDEKRLRDRLITSKIDEALAQIDRGEFGQCIMGDGEVEEERLALDFTTCVCLGHYSESQISDLEKDLELAAKVQRQLFPHAVPAPAGAHFAVRTEAAKIVGGDYVDFFPFRDSLQGFAIADVMGKGLPASMLMSNLQASLRILAPDNDTLDKTVTRLHELFRYNLKTIRFITLFLGALDMEKRLLHFNNAGHNPPLWLHDKTGKVELLEPTGPALGILAEADFKTRQIHFQPGDVFLFYTDGLIEARDGREEFGEERLQDFLRQHRDEPAQQILATLFQHIKEFAAGELDDLTGLVIKIDK